MPGDKKALDRVAFVAAGLLLVAAAAWLTHYFETHGLLAMPSRALLDTLPRTMDSTPSINTAIVAINDEDYASLFRATSPLKQDQVVDLINAIQSFGPRIVGVDLDTEHWKGSVNLRNSPGRLVWARLFTPDPAVPLTIRKPGVLPGREGPLHCSGLTGMQADSDFVIRQYQEQFASAQEEAYLSFPRVIHLLLLGQGCQETGPRAEEPKTEENWDEHRLLIQYRGERHEIRRVSAGAVLEAARVPLTNPAAIRMWDTLGGRVVLLGGAYTAGRDRYPTPVGMLSGVEILAHAIETELAPPIIELSRLLLWIDIGLGILLVIAGAYFGRLAVVLTLVSMVLLLFVSQWLYRSQAVFFNSMPILGAVLIHNLLDPFVEPWLHRIERRLRPEAPGQSTPPARKH